MTMVSREFSRYLNASEHQSLGTVSALVRAHSLLTILFCLPSEDFGWVKLCQGVCNPAVFLLLSLQDVSGCSTLHVEKFRVSFEYGLAFPVVSEHYGDDRILFEVPITSCSLVDSEVEYSVNDDQIRGRKVWLVVRPDSGCDCQDSAVGEFD